MIHKLFTFLVCSLALSLSALAQAPVTPQPGPGDPRIRQILYNENQVIALRALMGFEMVIEFGADERIENVSIGDSVSFQVTPNRKATLLFVKPMATGASTSMTVATSARIYSFILSSTEPSGPNDPRAILRLRFTYPIPPAVPVMTEPAPPPVDPSTFNFAYTYKGAKALAPVRVFDDGNATYFQFQENRDVPAIMVLGSDKSEEMANTRIDGGNVVVDRVAEIFILRYGKSKTEVHNNAWKDPASGGRVIPQTGRRR
jgi:type IV secretion system protein VirB9